MEFRQNKISLSLEELSGETSLSVPFWRKEIAGGRLRAKKVGRRVCVLMRDAEIYFESQPDWTPSGERVNAALAA